MPYHYCFDCDRFEWIVEGSKIVCILKPPPPTPFEKLQAILNNGIDYIYQKALLNFSSQSVPSKVYDEFNAEFTDPYCGMECILCARYLSICKCYDVSINKKTFAQLYGHFVDIEKGDAEINDTFTTTEAVSFENKIINHNTDF